MRRLLPLLLLLVLPASTAYGVNPLLPNLVPGMSGFLITRETFGENDDSVLDECVEEGEHRLLRFDVWVNNEGLVPFFLGTPEDQPEHFVWSNSHGHHHVYNFNKYRLVNVFGHEIVRGYKQGFCLMDLVRISDLSNPEATFDCNVQGISPGWGDVYVSSLPCQFVILDDAPDGMYFLEVTVNAQHLVREGDYEDNVLWVALLIDGSTVRTIP